MQLDGGARAQQRSQPMPIMPMRLFRWAQGVGSSPSPCCVEAIQGHEGVVQMVQGSGRERRHGQAANPVVHAMG